MTAIQRSRRGPEQAARPPQPFSVIRPAMEWQGKEVPPRAWLIENVLTRRGVTLITGPGGAGKSLLAQQLLTCAALGIDWLGLKVPQVKAFGFFCEDDPEELQRRQDQINRHYGVDMMDLENLTLQSRVGMDNILMTFNRFTHEGHRTATYEQIAKHIVDEEIELVFIDTAADTFGGNENDRGEVRSFVNALRQLTYRIEGGVILSAHPSVSGMATGSGTSGSTAWSAAARRRLYLTYPKNDQGEDDERSDDRLFKGKKSNYGKGFEDYRLRYENGVFIRLDDPGHGGVVDRIDMDNRLLEGLAELVRSGQMVAAAAKARNGFASLVRDLPSCKQFTFGACLSAQGRLVDAGKIVKVELGPPKKRYTYLRTPDTVYPGEVGAVGGPLGETA